MPIPSPFHERTAALCSSFRWKEWAGFLAVCSYEPGHELEYHAFRHAAGLLDVSPLYKYRVAGADAASFLAYVVTRDIRKLREGALPTPVSAIIVVTSPTTAPSCASRAVTPACFA